MTAYTSIEGQSLYDVCLNTYGSFDFIVKLINDNNIPNMNYYPVSGYVFNWDETLTTDQGVNIINNNSNVIYATKVLKNGSIRSVVQSGANNGTTIGNGYNVPNNPNLSAMVKYQQTAEVQYVASGGETSVTLTELINSTIVQITREIKPLGTTDYSLNPNTGLLTLNNGIVLEAEETLFIIYGIIITH